MSTSSCGSSPVDVPDYSTQFVPGPDDSDTLWNVLEIIKEDKKRYLVKWEGVDPDTGKAWDPSWVPKGDCTDDLIYEWKVRKAKKDKARKKKRKSKDEMDAYDPNPKHLTKVRKAQKSKSNTASSASSHQPSSNAGPSRLKPDALSGKVSPVVALVHHKKRRRESHPLDGESPESVIEEVPPPRKHLRIANQRDDRSSSPPSKEKVELTSKLGQPSSRSRDHDGLDAINLNLNGTSSRSPGGQLQGTTSPHQSYRRTNSREKEQNNHEVSESGISPSSTRAQRALIPDTYEPGSAGKIAKRPIVSHRSEVDIDQGYGESGDLDEDPVGRKSVDNDGRPDQFPSLGDDHGESMVFGVDNDENQINLDDNVRNDRDADADNHRRSSSPPSPRRLLLGMGKGMDTIIPETQSSMLTSQPEPHAIASKVILPQKDGKLESTKRPTKGSESRTSLRVDSKQARGPVRAISPTEFESYVSKARSVPPDSQISPIESFSPNKNSQVTTNLDAKRKSVDPQLRDIFAYPRPQSQGTESHAKHDSSLHDPIGDYETSPSDQELKLRGARLAEAARQQRSLCAYPTDPRRLLILSDIISSSISSNLNEKGGEFDMGGNDVVLVTESHQHDEGLENCGPELESQSATEFSKKHRGTSPKMMDKPLSIVGLALHSNDADTGGDQRELHQDETDVLGPEDALDVRESPNPPIPTAIFSSAEVNYSLEANPALTQQSASRLPVIASPVRELNHALGLLNRKSEEIDLLKVALKDHQSRMAELDGELVRLKRNLEVAADRYEEVNMALNKEKATKLSWEERVDESASKNFSMSSAESTVSSTELHRENEELKLAKAQLESDTTMLRRLYAEASEAHQTRVVEIKALERDNDSLREQATTGVKQANLFWTTQVHTLEKELILSKGTIELLTDQAQRTDNGVRTRAALLPMAQREAESAKQETEDWKLKFMELGKENTRLRLEVKGWEDEAMMRRKKEEEIKGQESAVQGELVWMCPWMDIKHGTKCGALLESREKLREHLYEAGHI